MIRYCKLKNIFIIWVLGTVFQSFMLQNVYSEELRTLYFGGRYLGMAGAMTASATGVDALWLNPAGLAGNHGLGINYGTSMLEVSNTILDTYTESLEAISALGSSSLDLSSLNVMMGKNI